jgi:Domain of unknown function (DUF4864)
LPNPIRRALCLIAGTLCMARTPFAAEPVVAADDAKAIRQVIEAQLAAFRANNAERAFSYASPSIRGMFGNADAFIAMVRGGYPVVYRPVTVSFMLPQIQPGTTGNDVVQRVRMTDGAGTAWLAIYSMQRQPDRSWRINGCVATRDASRTT